jgi:hypothetical protein
MRGTVTVTFSRTAADLTCQGGGCAEVVTVA